MPRLVIADDRKTSQCYAAYLDAHAIGQVSWILVHDTVLLPHIEVAPDQHDLGIGSLLVRRAVDDARAEDHTVLALCPYVRRWVQLHPASLDVVRTPAPGELGAISDLLAAERTMRKLHRDDVTTPRA